MKNLLTILTMSVILTACESSDKSTSDKDLKPQADSLLNEVMKAHDEVMPQTLVLEKLKKKINSRMDSVELDSAMKLGIQNTKNDIDTAIIGMRNWMYNFDKPEDSIGLESIIEYYQSQIAIMEKVKKQTFDALPEAEARLSELDSL